MLVNWSKDNHKMQPYFMGLGKKVLTVLGLMQFTIQNITKNATQETALCLVRMHLVQKLKTWMHISRPVLLFKLDAHSTF